MAVEVRQTSDRVVVSLSGLDRIFALKGRLDIPKPRIIAVEVLERRKVPYESKS